MAYVPPLNGGRINASIGGNSTSAGAGYALVSTGTMLLAGGNNVTLSQNGANITISGANQSNPNVSLYALGNTTQNSSTLLNASNLSFNGLGNISVGFSNGSIQISQTGGGGGGIAVYDGANSITSGTARFSNSNGVSFGINGQTITGSVAAQSNQSVGLYGVGNTTQNSSTTLDARTISFNGLGGATVGFSNGSVQISAPQTVAQSNQSVGLYALGNTTQNSSTTLDARSLSFNGLGMITAGYSNGSIQLSATQSNQDISLYALGNTTQNSSTKLNASNLSFNGLGNATVGFSNGSIQISVTGGGAGGGVALYDGANSISSGTARFSNSNGVSFGFNGQTITGSVAAQSNQTVGIYASGANTIGQSSSSTLDARSVNISGQGALSAGLSGSTLQLSAPATSSISVTGGLSASTNGSTISLGISPMSQWMHNSAALYSSSTSAMVNTSVSVVRMLIPYALSFSRVDIPVSISGATSATANTAAMALSAVGVLYSRNGSTLNPIVGQSSTTTYSYASNSGVYSSITGPRMMSFNLATSLTAGEYYMGVQLSSAVSSVGTATTSLGWTVAPIFGTSYSVLPWQDISAATNQTVNILQPLQGMNNVSISNTTQTMQQSQITQSGATAIRANLVVILRNS